MVQDKKTKNKDFNPRSLTGATASCLDKISMHVVFQSTLPYGSDFWGKKNT